MASNQRVHLKWDKFLFISLYAQQGFRSAAFFILDGISPPIQQHLSRYAAKTVLSLLFTIMEINPYMTFNLFAWINNVSLIRLTKGARARRCSPFYATISIREADSFNQLIMDVRGACSDRTGRPQSSHTNMGVNTHTHPHARPHAHIHSQRANNVPKLQWKPDNQLKRQSLYSSTFSLSSSICHCGYWLFSEWHITLFFIQSHSSKIKADFLHPIRSSPNLKVLAFEVSRCLV